MVATQPNLHNEESHALVVEKHTGHISSKVYLHSDLDCTLILCIQYSPLFKIP